MSKNIDRNLDIISNIDEDIIDKNTEKRIKYINRAKKKKFIPIIAIAAALSLIMGAMLAIFIPMLTAKQAPIYTGMTASGSMPNSAYVGGFTPLSAVIPLNNDNTEGNNGNHGSNNPNKKPIKDIIGTIEVIPQEELYYAKPNEDIFITIHFDNPDEYTIMSFKLNGKPYASYMFEYGSDYENIIIKVNVGEVEGLVDYTIDAIQYADRETLKYVEMKGDPTLTIGVSTEKQPVAKITDEVIDINEMSFTVTVNDELELIKLTEGILKAVITDGESIIAEQELTVGETAPVKFENLKTSTYYQYAIVAEYDALDGKGFTNHIIYSKEITTREVIAFSEVTSDKTSISFSTLFNEDAKTKEITKIELYLGENKVKDIDITATEITDLLSNNEYRIVVFYTNKGATESISYAVKTLAKETPTVTLTQKGESTQTSFEFDLFYTDTDAVGSIIKLELLHGNDEPINVEDLSTRAFENLLSNNDYTVRVTFVYDLNDGVGEQTESKELTVKTKAKAKPTVMLTQKGESTQTSFEFDLVYTDTDAVGAKIRLELLHGNDEPINVEDLSTRAFENLLSNNDYTVRVTFVYDLNDGVGDQTATKELTVKTKAKAVPVVGLNNYVSEFESVSFNIGKISDPDNIGELIKAEFYAFDGTLLRELELNTDITLNDLVLMDNYSVVITIQYDLNDGRGMVTETVEKNVSTAISEGLTYYNGYITGIGSCTDTVLYINTNIDTCAFLDNKNITKVVFGRNVTSIGFAAFKNCTNLTGTLDLSNVTSIGGSAFSGCSGLEGVVFGESLKTISESAFRNCKNLSGTIDLSNVTSIGDGAFYECSSLKGVVFGERLETIPQNVFSGCVNLSGTIDLSNVMSIGEGAFSGCSGLEGVLDLSSVTDIGTRAFYNCSSLEGVVFGESLETIPGTVFFNCKNLSGTLDLSNVKHIGSSAFYYCEEIDYVILGEDFDGILDSTFKNCRKLKKIEGISYVKKIKNGALGGCSMLEGTLDLSNVIDLGNDAFSSCGSIKEIIFGSQLESLHENALGHCRGITDIYYTGTQEEWEAVWKHDEWDFDTHQNYTIHYNYVPTKN